MLYVVIILLLIALIISAAALIHLNIELHLKNSVLNVSIGNKLYKKTFVVDFLKGTSDNNSQKNEPKEDSAKKEGKFKDLKERLYSKEKGIDFDELAKVKDEFCDAYSSTVGIIKEIFGHLRHKIKIPVLKITLEYGTGDAAATGILYGSIWSVVSVLYPIAVSWAKMDYPVLDITPDFYGKRFNLEALSIIKVRPVHIINAVIALIFSPNLTYFKNNMFKKGREKNDR